MNKIESIETITGARQKISDLEQPFLTRVKTLVGCPTTPVDRLKKLQRKQQNTGLAIVTYCINNFDNIITNSPDKLALTITHFDAMGWTHYIDGNKKFRISLLNCFGYKRYFRSEPTKGIWYGDQLNIKACPYCNAQFTVTTRKNGNPTRARFQFDHFFSKIRYPYLSISMYNLVPSCADCNLSKTDQPVSLIGHYHPYYSSICDKMRFKLNNASVLKSLLADQVDKQSIKTSCEHVLAADKQFVADHCQLFDIEGIYENHADYAEELVLKSIRYPEAKRAELLGTKNLFKDESTFYRYVLGNYPYRDDIHKRPLAKFTQDIARQLKLID